MGGFTHRISTERAKPQEDGSWLIRGRCSCGWTMSVERASTEQARRDAEVRAAAHVEAKAGSSQPHQDTYATARASHPTQPKARMTEQQARDVGAGLGCLYVLLPVIVIALIAFASLPVPVIIVVVIGGVLVLIGAKSSSNG